MKKALVLAGGGAKGAYEAGFIKALCECDIHIDIVVGTSIGALNACLFAQKDFQALDELWKTIRMEDVIAGYTANQFHFDIENLVNQSHLMISFFKKYIQEKGVDITPLKRLIRNLLNEKKLLQSSIDFGLCTVRYPTLNPLFITKKEMKEDHILNYLIASASCFPLFPIHNLDNQSYIDGGYYDNLPIDLAYDMGAKEIIVVDMSKAPTHPHYVNQPHVTYVYPYNQIEGFMDFSREKLDYNYRIGYLMAMKTFGNYVGARYTFQLFNTFLFEIYYEDLLYFDRKIRLYKRNDNVSLIYDIFQGYCHKQLLEEKDYLYCVLDWLLELMEWDDCYVYHFPIVVESLKNEFEKYLKSDHKIFKSQENLIRTLQSMHKKYIVGWFLYVFTNPKKSIFDLQLLTTLFVKEACMARFLYLIFQQY